jgi:hypothetical protein
MVGASSLTSGDSMVTASSRPREALQKVPVSANSTEDSLLGGVAERLTRKYAGPDGPLSEDEVAGAVHEAADSLRGAPVQTFVVLITENKARKRLRERANETLGHD